MKRVVEKVQFIPKMPALLNVAAYARVSSGKDAMLHSLSAQVSYYSEKIQKHPGRRYCGVYADEAMTGTKEDREHHSKRGCERMTRDELKEQIDELMRQYADEEIDGDTYFQKMMELTTSARDENND